ncbi:MAG TPA: phospholipase D-like domain-containing protein [Pseudolabrys sp.]|nr:phospholipase D-like domain-containing protein [Pseudolabrys sp.]
MEYIFVTLYVLIAAVTSAHALLTKSDVRAALAWIAVAWLSPFLGAFLYFAFGINRVTRRALHLARHDHRGIDGTGPDAQPDMAENVRALAAVGQRVTGSSLIAGNAVSVYQGGDEAYPVMLEAIRTARRSVALASYIFWNDEIGRAFVEALTDAHRRGVAVRVLIDSIGGGYFWSGAAKALQANGVPTALFLHTWLPWRMPFLNMRNHKKLLIVDGKTAFTGGLNISAKHSLRLARSKKTYVDGVQVRVEGPVAGQFLNTFAEDWSFTTGELLEGEAWWPPIPSAGPVLARGIHSGPDADMYKLETILGAALAQARKRVRIVTPYFLPDQRLQFALAQAGLRGVKVEILIPEHCDYAFMDWAMRAHLRFFDKVPATVYFTRAPFNHAKLMTVDEQWCLIGSSNWDTRSLRLNFEFDLECYDHDLTAEIDAVIESKIAQSRQVDLGRLSDAPAAVRLRDAAFRLLQPYL